MAVVYLTTQGAQAHLHNGRLIVTYGQETLLRLPLTQISLLVLFGNIGLTTPLMGALLEKGAEIVFLTRYGRFRGRLHGHDTPHVALRRLQYAALENPTWVLQMVRGLVTAKIQHQRGLLQRYRRRKGTVPPEVDVAISRLQTALQTAGRKRSANALRGVEGTAARAYFGGLKALFRPACRFQGRNRRPPRDPVNALLSLGYTILLQKAQSAVQAVGLDPYAGFLHVADYGRPSMALDLMEEFRPVVDGMVLKVCNQGLLSPEDFTYDGPNTRPVSIKDEGLRRFLKDLESRFSQRFLHPIRKERLTLNQSLVEQAYQIARRLRENRPGYRGMGFR